MKIITNYKDFIINENYYIKVSMIKKDNENIWKKIYFENQKNCKLNLMNNIERMKIKMVYNIYIFLLQTTQIFLIQIMRLVKLKKIF